LGAAGKKKQDRSGFRRQRSKTTNRKKKDQVKQVLLIPTRYSKWMVSKLIRYLVIKSRAWSLRVGKAALKRLAPGFFQSRLDVKANDVASSQLHLGIVA